MRGLARSLGIDQMKPTFTVLTAVVNHMQMHPDCTGFVADHGRRVCQADLPAQVAGAPLLPALQAYPTPEIVARYPRSADAKAKIPMSYKDAPLRPPHSQTRSLSIISATASPTSDEWPLNDQILGEVVHAHDADAPPSPATARPLKKARTAASGDVPCTTAPPRPLQSWVARRLVRPDPTPSKPVAECVRAPAVPAPSPAQPPASDVF